MALLFNITCANWWTLFVHCIQSSGQTPTSKLFSNSSNFAKRFNPNPTHCIDPSKTHQFQFVIRTNSHKRVSVARLLITQHTLKIYTVMWAANNGLIKSLIPLRAKNFATKSIKVSEQISVNIISQLIVFKIKTPRTTCPTIIASDVSPVCNSLRRVQN